MYSECSDAFIHHEPLNQMFTRAPMYDRRHESRIPSEIEVHVTALSEAGSPCTQTALARNLSVSGGLLAGLERKLRCGDLIRIQYHESYARFRVVWIANSAHGPFTAAVHKLKDDPCPWAEALIESATGISK